MTKKQKLIARIKELLIEKGANESNKLEHDIYLIDYRRRDDDQWCGRLWSIWLDKNGDPMCYVRRWGVGFNKSVENLTCTNLGFILEYLVNGYVVQ